MNEHDFYEAVRRRADLESAEAARGVTAATLETLGDRLSDGEVADVAPSLPDGVAEPFVDAGEGGTGGFSFEEFVGRVADRTGATEADALRYSRAVGATLVEAVGREGLRDARSQLPNEYDRLLWASDRREFLDLVRREVDSDEEANAAATATLRALGERITAGEAEDVAGFLPAEFADALLRAETPATDRTAEEFVERVADHAGVDPAVARTYVLAVTAALAEAIPDYEYQNVLDQLPAEYLPLLATPDRDDRASR